MNILLTGANSFTGYWFAQSLADAGHSLTMTLRRAPTDYDGVRRQRADALASFGRVEGSCTFGDDAFLKVIRDVPAWDVLCHHAADVTDYRSEDFDVAGAFAANTRNLDQVLANMTARGCRALTITGSVFEPGEGAGSDGLPAFSAYGLSKALTAQSAAFYAARHDLPLGKFVIPNPFGPFEEPRFTAYLLDCWFKGETASIRTPAYIRDNIHVSLLARSYASFVENLVSADGPVQLNPSGYIESQASFAMRFQQAMQTRLDLPCALELLEQTVFSEPRVRINTDPVDAAAHGWSPGKAWDEIAAYYERQHRR